MAPYRQGGIKTSHVTVFISVSTRKVVAGCESEISVNISKYKQKMGYTDSEKEKIVLNFEIPVLRQGIKIKLG